MTSSGNHLFSHWNYKAIFLIIALTIPALYLNLGLIPLKGDESIRAVVSLEMMLSGDYVTPTLYGELYFNKPPLYNWILTGFFSLFHSCSEWIVRLPTTLFLLLYCLIIYGFVKKQLGKQMALLSSFAFLTCGRILFWDSYLGLIDILYSMLMFTNFMVIWNLYRKQSYTRMFILSWIICAAGFLLKGIPTLAFEAITIFMISIQHRKFKPLFSAGSFTGVILFIAITGSYYYLYAKRNPGYVDNALLRLITESTDKSAIGSDFAKTALHLVTFPFELIQHFLPWFLFVVFLFNVKIARRVVKNEFIRYCLMVFTGNIMVYWFSPTTYPRYLLMLVPLAFIAFLYAGKMHAFLSTPVYKVIRILMVILIVGLPVSSVVLPIVFSNQIPVNHLFLKSMIVAALAVILYLVSYGWMPKAGLLYFTVIALLISRISFDLFLLPYRESKDWLTACRHDAIELSHGTLGKPMYFLTDTLTIHNVYYLTRERNEILQRGIKPDTNSYFIIEDTSKYIGFTKAYSMRVPYHYKTYYAGKFEKNQP